MAKVSAVKFSELEDVRKRLATDKEHSNLYRQWRDKFTGPDTGLVFDDDDNDIRIASGWHVEGDQIVKDF